MTGPQPIPFKEMESFGTTHLFNDDLIFFIRVMEELDLAFTDYYAEKRDQEEKSKKSKGS